MSKAVLHSVLAIEAILWGLLSAVIIGTYILRFELDDPPKIYKICASPRIRCEKGAHPR